MAMLRLATFNLLHGTALDDGSADPSRLRASAHEVDADVLALQEVDRDQPRSGHADQTAVAAAGSGARWHRFVPTVLGTPGVRGWRPAPARPDDDPRDDDPRDGDPRDGDPRDGDPTEHETTGPTFGVGLVSRLPVLRWRVRRFGAAPGRLPLLVPTGSGLRVVLVPDEPRAALAAVLDGPHGPFTVVGTHLSFVPGFNVRQLRAIVRWLDGMPRPAFLLGDLNLPGGVPARVTGWRPLAAARTYPSFGPRVQLDHLLADGLDPDAVRTDHVWTLPVSDHCALGVDVDV